VRLGVVVTPPPCLHCGQPVQHPKAKYAGKRGLRIVGGLLWNWFCTRGCAGTEQGRINISQNLAHRADKHREWVSARRIASWADELAICQRYHMPRDLAVGILGRVYRRGQESAYVAAHQKRRKAAA
jgi:hypothetical protein